MSRSSFAIASGGAQGFSAQPAAPSAARRALDGIESLPCIPAIALQVMRVTDDGDVGADELASIISLDPVLSAKLLQTANSALFGGMAQITTVKTACMRLGFKTVRLTALSVALLDTIRTRNFKGFDQHDYRRRCLVHAVGARIFADAVARTQADEAFMSGMLARIGQLVIATSLPEGFSALTAATPDGWREPDPQRELDVLGFSSYQLGAELLRSWSIPRLICDAIENSCNPEAANPPLDPPTRQLTRILQIGGLCVDLVYNSEKSKTLAKLRETCAAHFGLDSERVETILEQLDRRALEMGRILDVGMSGSVDIESIMQEAQREVLQETLRLLQTAIASELQAADLRSENARLLRSAQTDPLTGLANRSTLYDALGSCIRCSDPSTKRNSLALILADVDHFKSINDTFGHSVGDRALRLIAQAIIDVTREGDLAARFGGDEFVVALPKATEGVLAQVGERIRSAVERLVLPTASGPARITLSIGGVVCEDLDSPGMVDQLIEAADSRMYEAKQRGGNQCRFGLGRVGDVVAVRHRL